MPFISYAQNYEDVMLWRALHDIKKGTYIDVGANDPTELSVTRAFYDRGWRGINIEPVPRWYRKLMAERPEDINLNVAVSNVPGELKMLDVVDTGLSTLDPPLIRQLKEQGTYGMQEITVTARTLDSILADHPLQNIHFLKIDVEGFEEQVLRSIDLSKTRPWIILAERLNVQFWGPLLTAADYDFVYFDGLNNSYVAKEKSELKAAFSAPPNVFDDFIRINEYRAVKQLEDLGAALRATEAAQQRQPLYRRALRRIRSILRRMLTQPARS